MPHGYGGLYPLAITMPIEWYSLSKCEHIVNDTLLIPNDYGMLQTEKCGTLVYRGHQTGQYPTAGHLVDMSIYCVISMGYGLYQI